jgi:MFS family permease
MRIGYSVMGLGAFVAFAGAAGEGAPPAVRYLGVLAFSLVGGLVPATLFALAMRLAPDERTLSTTVGWIQQWSSLGQFVGPPMVAWIASRAGGWHWTWAATGTSALLGLLLTVQLQRLLAARSR